MAAWVLDMFCELYVVKNHKIAINSIDHITLEKIQAQIWNPYNFRNFYDVGMTKYENTKTLCD
jgi:hypothetical protein